ncbi:DUF4232 domain-containing protein [Streptomyces hokutonensis]|uniref:DUF4232 domain-containing protein n=1 Tax=Streptomyces hokutonensis TaxID=1306990 RepID=UPI0037FB5328
MSDTIFRRRTALLAAGLAATASLALTACGTEQAAQDRSNPAAADSGASATATPGTDTGAAASGTDSAVTVSKPGRSGTAAKGSTGSKGSSGTVTCTGANTQVTAQTVTRPLNHLLLAVKNTGSQTCNLYGYPALDFQDAQAVPPVDKDTQPQAVTTLRPGQSGYAGVLLSAADGSGSGGYTAKTLKVIFQNRALDFVGSGVKVALPAKGVWIDSSLTTTYWLTDPEDALD